ADVFTNFSRYPDLDAQMRFYLPLLDRLQSAPGVGSAAITNAVPLATVQPFNLPLQIEGQAVDNPDKRPNVDARIVSSDYFKTLGMTLIQGRFFSESDTREAPLVVVVNKSMMRYWEGKDPIGTRVSIDNGQSWATVAGIVGDVKQFGLDHDSVAQVYVPLRQTTQGLGARLLVRTTGDTVAAAQAIKNAVRSIDPDMPLTNVRTLEEIRSDYLATPRLTATLLTMFAGLALLVTMAGLAGVIGTSVSERTQEFGLRMAMGATRGSVLRMVVRQGLTLVITGLALGAIISYAFTGALSSYLFDTRITDPVSMAAVLVTLVGAGALACLGPALRATTVDPLVALRAE
ncbi:MAG: FtsX-like permease family protein, partial [Vicinamibacteria bacterium]